MTHGTESKPTDWRSPLTNSTWEQVLEMRATFRKNVAYCNVLITAHWAAVAEAARLAKEKEDGNE